MGRGRGHRAHPRHGGHRRTAPHGAGAVAQLRRAELRQRFVEGHLRDAQGGDQGDGPKAPSRDECGTETGQHSQEQQRARTGRGAARSQVCGAGQGEGDGTDHGSTRDTQRAVGRMGHRASLGVGPWPRPGLRQALTCEWRSRLIART